MTSTPSTSQTLRRPGAAAALLFSLIAGLLLSGLWVLNRRTQNLTEAMALQGSELHARALLLVRKIYDREIVAHLRDQGVAVAHDYKERGLAIPPPATFFANLAAEYETIRPGAVIRLRGDHPFPWRAGRPEMDGFEREAFAELRRAPERPFYRFETYQGRPSLRYAVAEQMSETCTMCHNDNPASTKRDWQVGDVAGFVEVIRPLDERVAAAQSALWQTTVLLAVLSIAVPLLVWLIVRRTRSHAAEHTAKLRAAIVKIAAVVLTCEAVLFCLLPAFGGLPEWVRALVTAMLMTVFSSPLIYYWIIVPLDAELTRQLDERSNVTALAADIALAVAPGRALHESLQLCAQAFVDRLDVSFARIWTYHEGDAMLELKASAGLYTHIDGGHARVPLGVFKIGRIAASRKPHLTNNVIGDHYVGNQEWAVREKMVSFAGYPLLHGDELVGVVAMFSRKRMSGMTMRSLAAVANYMALGIVERRIAAEREQSYNMLQATVDALTDHVAILDREGRILAVNEAWRRFAKSNGLRCPNWCVGRNYVEVCEHAVGADSERAVEMANAMRSIARGELNSYCLEYPCHSPEEQRWFTVNVTRFGEGEAVRLVVAHENITERKRLETERLTRLRIEQEHEHLEQAIRAQERVLGIVGHELRTPLAGLRAMAEFLLMDAARETAEFDTFLKGIHDEAIRMAGLVGDLLEVARLNSGAAQWNWTTVDLAETCGAAIDTVRPLVDESNVELTARVTPEHVQMNGDAAAIRRLLVNLLSNSCKHTRAGSIRVEVTGRTRADGRRVEMTVSDTGCGMPPEVAAQLGQAFALNSGVVGENHVQGAGLGLAICRGIVAAHGGTVIAQTAPGKGTTIRCSLRADLAEAAPVGDAARILCEAKT